MDSQIHQLNNKVVEYFKCQICRLADPLQEPFQNSQDERFAYVESWKTILRNMNIALTPHSHRVMGLTEKTTEAWVISLTGVTELTKVLVEKILYVLPREFGTYCHLAGENFNISYKQVLSSLSSQN